MNGVDRELRDWLRSLAGTADSASPPGLSAEAADVLERMATDVTLRAALNEINAGEPDLAG